jgi:hypothetical protein
MDILLVFTISLVPSTNHKEKKSGAVLNKNDEQKSGLLK